MKKKYLKPCLIFVIILLCVLCLVLCLDEEKPKEAQKAVQGFSRKDLAGENGLTLLSVLSQDARMEDKYLVIDHIYPFDSGQAVIACSLYDTLTDMQGDGGRREYLVSCDLSTMTFGKTLDITAPEGAYDVCEQEGLLWVWQIEGSGAEIRGYDAELSLQKTFTAETGKFGTFAPDGKTFYEISEGRLVHTDVSSETFSPQPVNFDTPFLPAMFSGLVPNGKGGDYGLMYGIAGDLKYYTAVADLATGHMLYMRAGDPDLTYIDHGVLVHNRSWDGEENGGLFEVYAGGGLFSYRFAGELPPTLMPVGDNLLLFIAAEDTPAQGTDLQLWLYDGASGRKLGTAVLHTEDTSAYITQAFVYREEEALLLCVTQESAAAVNSGAAFYRWDYSKGKEELPEPEVAPLDFSAGAAGTIAVTQDPVSYVPGPCPAELSDLKAQADGLGARFGLQVKISDECRSIQDNYAVAAMSDRAALEESLDLLEKELSRYPEGFFRQFVWDGIEGMDIYLAGALTGMTERSLDAGGGFTAAGDGRLRLVLDCTEPKKAVPVLHHEIAHGIERKLQSGGEILTDDSQWNALNPAPDMYAESYQAYAERDYAAEGLADYIYGMGTDPARICFTDPYALTYPTEDRARIFEYAMTEAYDGIWQTYPRLKAKLDFFAWCIREGFDTAGWGPVPWEK